MTKRTFIFSQIPVLLLLASIELPQSGLTDGLRYLGYGYILFDVVLRGWAGYLRRRPHWTADSWRRYLKATAVPIGALVITFLMAASVDWRLPMVGAARSTVRATWVGGMVLFGIIGALGLGTALAWMHEGDPSRQFMLPGWLTFGRRRIA